MGGYGSTRWAWHTKKLTVEDCYPLAIFGLVKDILPKEPIEPDWSYSGIRWWQRSRDEAIVASMGYTLEWRSGRPLFWLEYTITDRRGEQDALKYPIQLQSTTCGYGGRRWWFTCPGADCGRRVGKVYLPPGGRYFGCRHCYALTYTSAQEAHQFDRSPSVGHLVHNLELLTRAKLVKRKLDRAHVGSKRWYRLLERHDQIMSKLQPLDLDR